MEEVLVHLIRGWEGFARILGQQTGAGVKLPREELRRLETAHAAMAEVIRLQRELMNGR